MQYCEQCGNPVYDGDFCTNCGARIGNIQEQPVRSCWKCGAALEQGDFCTNCGASQSEWNPQAQWAQQEEEPPRKKRGGLIALVILLLCVAGVGGGYLAWRMIELPRDDRIVEGGDPEEDEEPSTDQTDPTEENPSQSDPAGEEPTQSEPTGEEPTQSEPAEDPEQATQPETTEPEETSPPEETAGSEHNDEEETEPEEVLTPVTLSSESQYNINIFLSNFSEQHFCEDTFEGFYAEGASAERLVDFVIMYKTINNASALAQRKNSDGEVYITLDEMNTIADRFFDRTVTISDIQSAGYRTYGQKIYWVPESGVAYDHMTVADGVWLREDGTYYVEFTIYTASGQYHSGTGAITNKNVYYLTPSQAASSDDLRTYLHGTAIVRTYNYNGRNTYQIISYNLKNDG